MKSNLDIARILQCKAKHDEDAAELIREAEGPTDIACFHYQQAAEKYLKAVLAAHDRPFPRSHDIAELAELVEDLAPALSELPDDVFLLSEHAVAGRYGEIPEPGDRDLQRARQHLAQIKRAIEGVLPAREEGE